MKAMWMELFAIVYGLTTYDWMFRQGTTKIWSDHSALRYFGSTMKMNSRLARWQDMLSSFNFEIQYRKRPLVIILGITPSTRPRTFGKILVVRTKNSSELRNEFSLLKDFYLHLSPRPS
jgi:hypothetical protein